MNNKPSLILNKVTAAGLIWSVFHTSFSRPKGIIFHFFTYICSMKTPKLLALAAFLLTAASCSNGKGEIAEPAPKPKPTNPTDPSGSETEPEFIFDTDLFEKHTDENSGVVSYLLKSGAGGWECSQSNYFNSVSMTEDERFIFFFGLNKNFAKNEERNGVILDLKTRKFYNVPHTYFHSFPYLDPKEDKLYYGYVYDNKTRATFYRRDLLEDPSKDIKLVDLPSSLIFSAGDGYPLKRLASHLTLTQDKSKVFLDMRINDDFVYGLLDLKTAAWEEWGRTDVNLTHGQLNPVRDDIALMAIDTYTKLSTGEKVEIEYDEDGTFPRLQLVKKGGYRETLKPDMTRDKTQYPGGYASHENWDVSGEYVYWCSGGACIRNLANRDDFKKYDYSNGASWASHSTFSKGLEYITFDDQSLDFYRGCRWRVAFYNIKKGKMVYIYTLLPALVSKEEYNGNATTKNIMDTLHPDPHPQFVCNDKYIICTAQGSDKTLRLSITPVDQLIELTK